MPTPTTGLSIENWTNMFAQVLTHDEKGRHAYLVKDDERSVRVCKPGDEGYTDLGRRMRLEDMQKIIQDLTNNALVTQPSALIELRSTFSKIIAVKNKKLVSLARKIRFLHVIKIVLYCTLVGIPIARRLASYIHKQCALLTDQKAQSEKCLVFSPALENDKGEPHKDALKNIFLQLLPKPNSISHRNSAETELRKHTRDIQKLAMTAKFMSSLIPSKAALVNYFSIKADSIFKCRTAKELVDTMISHRIKVLHLHSDCRLDASHLETLARECPEIEELYVWYYPLFNDANQNSIADAIAKLVKLKKIEVRFGVPFKFIEAIGKLPQLETLYLEDSIYFHVLPQNLSLFKNLKSLWVDFMFPNVKNDDIGRIIAGCQNLTDLTLQVTSDSIQAACDSILQLPACQKLRNLGLILISENHVPEAGINSISQIETLERLSLWGKNIPLNTIIPAVRKINSFKELKVNEEVIPHQPN